MRLTLPYPIKFWSVTNNLSQTSFVCTNWCTYFPAILAFLASNNLSWRFLLFSIYDGPSKETLMMQLLMQTLPVGRSESSTVVSSSWISYLMRLCIFTEYLSLSIELSRLPSYMVLLVMVYHLGNYQSFSWLIYACFCIFWYIARYWIFLLMFNYICVRSCLTLRRSFIQNHRISMLTEAVLKRVCFPVSALWNRFTWRFFYLVNCVDVLKVSYSGEPLINKFIPLYALPRSLMAESIPEFYKVGHDKSLVVEGVVTNSNWLKFWDKIVCRTSPLVSNIGNICVA